MPASKAQQRAVAKYMAANYDEMKIRIPKGRKKDIENYLESNEEFDSINGWVSCLIRRELGLTEGEWKRSPEEDEGEHKTVE
ncbi:MAG: hypothetical protein IJB41_01110 [Clostridia bacterium]|nr:hypothetical protein [Clostridia bacterium]